MAAEGLYTTEHGLNTTDVKIETPEGIAFQQDLVHCLYKWISINNILAVDFEVRVNWKCKVNIFFSKSKVNFVTTLLYHLHDCLYHSLISKFALFTILITPDIGGGST